MAVERRSAEHDDTETSGDYELAAETGWQEARRAVAAQRSSLAVAAHRPWPMPPNAWLMGQSWRNLLFAHWPVPADVLRPLIPPTLRIDTWDGHAWLGITPFAVVGLSPRLGPPLPVVSRFVETNVRTYVTVGDRPGIFFLTLDADSWLAVAGARVTYRLPYRRAAVRRLHSEGGVEHRTTSAALDLAANYRPAADGAIAPAGSLEWFLVERYCLYAARDGRIERADIHHRPWQLHRPADGCRIEGVWVRGVGALPPPALLHVAPRQDVVVWPPAIVL